MKYYVFYTQRCAPKTDVFKTELAAKRFIKKFLKTKSDDNWVDVLLKGEVLEVYDEYYRDLV